MAKSRKTGRKRKAAPVEREVIEPELVDPDEDPDADDSDGDSDESDEDLAAEVADDHGVAMIDVDDSVLDELLGPDPAEKAKKSVAKYDPMAAYMQEIRRVPLLSREEEHDIAVRYVEEGDLDAARRLIEANLRLVVKIAYEYRRAYRNILDLVQEGNVGLLQAVRKYDPYRGVKLSTYAAWWIRAYILKFILNNWRLVKIGTTQAQRKLFFNLRKESEKLEQLGFRPDPKLLAERLDVSEKEVVEMQKRLSAADASLDAPLGSADDDGHRTRLDMLEDQGGDRPDVNAAESEFRGLLREKLDIFGKDLTGREATIFARRWLTDEPMTLQEIGDEYGISRERARQIEKRLMGRLRTFLEKEFGGDVDISALSRE
jgi:RNA polymerase sigma-32 factor